MHVVVITKATPDTGAKLSVADGAVTWTEAMVLNPWDDYSVSQAVLLKEAHKAQTTILTLGTEEHNEALKQGLSIGCDQAIRIWDDALEGYDSLQYARAIAAAIQKLGDVDLIIFGKEFADSGTNQHVYQVARKLGFTALGSVSKLIEIDDTTIKVERSVEQGTETINAQLPAVLSVLKDIAEPKYPKFAAIRKAAKAVIPVWDLAELGIDAGTTAVTITGYEEPATRDGSVELIEGDDPRQIAEKLADKLIEDKVI